MRTPPAAFDSGRCIGRLVAAWLAALLLLAPEPVGAKTSFRRSFDPVPPGAFYASVWAGIASTITLDFEGDFLPIGQVETVFVENAEREPGTVVALAGQIGPTTWQAHFTLPRPGIWNGPHHYQVALPDGTVPLGESSFALQAVSRVPERPIVVTRNGEPLPACQPRDVAELVVRFFDAFNQGDQAHLTRLFGPQFHWYSVTIEADPSQGGHYFVAFNADDALAYFDERHQLEAVHIVRRQES